MRQNIKQLLSDTLTDAAITHICSQFPEPIAYQALQQTLKGLEGHTYTAAHFCTIWRAKARLLYPNKKV